MKKHKRLYKKPTITATKLKLNFFYRGKQNPDIEGLLLAVEIS